MFRPPVDRGMQVLNRMFFRKTVPLAAVKVFENSQIASCRKFLGRDILNQDRIPAVQVNPAAENDSTAQRSILLRPDIRPKGTNAPLQ